MHELDAQISMIISINHHMTLGEIQAKFLKKKSKTVKRHLDDLVKIGRLRYEKIKGLRSKRKRYFIPEERTEDDLWTRFLNPKSGRLEIHSINQRVLSAIISDSEKFYKKELKVVKKESDEEFFFWHTTLIASYLEWISRLTFAIYSGMFDDSENKLQLALRNRERFEVLLRKIVFNMREKDNERTYSVIYQMYEILDSIPLISFIYPVEGLEGLEKLYQYKLMQDGKFRL